MTQKTESTQLRHGPLAGLAIFVAVSATGLAGFFGMLASIFYGGVDLSEGRDPEIARVARFATSIGLWWGAATGLIAAVIWCRSMFRALARGERGRLTDRGARTGLFVGALATILLHAGLIVTDLALHRLGGQALIGPVIGLVFGLPAGAILGAISGAICQRIVEPHPRPDGSAEAKPS